MNIIEPDNNIGSSTSHTDILNQTIADRLKSEIDIRGSYFRLESSSWAYKDITLDGHKTKIKLSKDGNIVELTIGKFMLQQFFRGSLVELFMKNGLNLPSRKDFGDRERYIDFMNTAGLIINHGLEFDDQLTKGNFIMHDYPVAWSGDEIKKDERMMVLGFHKGMSYNYPAFKTDFYPLFQHIR